MFRYLATSLSIVVLCLAPLSALAGGPFQKSAFQKMAVQKAPLSVFQKGPMQVVQKAPMSVVQKMPMVAQKGFAPVACGPNIRYMQRRPCKKTCCGCTPAVQTMLQVQDPRGCGSCPVMVPVCLPGCCVGAPQVNTLVGLLGRGNVCFKWCCGYRVKIVFDNHGDIIVNYYGA